MSERVRSTEQRRDKKGVIRHGAEWLQLWSDPDSLRSAEERRALGLAAARHAAEGERLSAAARALAGRPGFMLPPEPTRDAEEETEAAGFNARRGRADSAALQARFHDPALHAALRPADPATARLFEIAERVRCEALGALRLRGVGPNLVAAQHERLEKADLLNAHLASLVPVTEALEMTLRDLFLGAGTESIASSGFWMWRRWLTTRLEAEFAAMAAALADQHAYSEVALAMIARLFARLESSGTGEREAIRRSGGADGTPAEDTADDEPQAGEHRLEAEREEASFEPGADVLDALGGEDVPRLPPRPEPEPQPYAVFTTEFDRVLDAGDIAPGTELRALRRKLDEKHADLRREVARLAARLQRKLLAKRLTNWEFDLEEGLLDAARLDRTIVDPASALAFKQERESTFRDTAVTILIDNSGSMRGRSIEIACLVADMAAAALDRCGVAAEILGYTTSAWKGGRSFRRWVEAGRPANPGRLNDLLHVVYKAADMPYRRARTNIAGMLHPDLLKENIDGEALLWAASRLRTRPEARKLLLVISDGAPGDQATMENNDDRKLLDRHLRFAISAVERTGDVALAAIGVKHDVSQYYRNAEVIQKVDALVSAVFDALDRVFDG